MKVTVNIPEAVVEQHGGPAACEQALIQRLYALPDYKVGEKIVVLDSAHRAQLEAILNDTFDTAEDVVRSASRMSAVQIGTVTRQLSAGESERIRRYADSHGIDYETALRQYVDPILAQWLDGF